MKSNLKHLQHLREDGTLELEFLALLIVLGLVLSAFSSFQNTIKIRKTSNHYKKRQLESFNCTDPNRIRCTVLRRRSSKSLELCKSIQIGEKCSYFIEK